MAPFDVVLIGGIFLLAGVLKGVVGLGLPTLALALMSPVIGVHAAMSAILLPSLATNVWQAIRGAHLTHLLRRLGPLLLCLGVGVVAAGELLMRVPEATVANVLGAVLVVYAAWSLAVIDVRVPATAERWLGPIAGLGTGILAGTTGTFVVPSVMYLRGLDWPRDALVQGMGLVFLTGTVALGLSLGRIGFLDMNLAGVSLGAVVPAMVGIWLGQRLRRRLSVRSFHRGMLLALGAIGLHLLLGGQ